MAPYTLMTDMTCDLSAQILDELHVRAIPMAFQLGENEYHHYPDEREIRLEEFYTRLKAGEDAVTSQINPATYIEYFEAELKEGRDILYLCFSSGLSGTINTAVLIGKQMEEEYPGRRVVIIDTLCASVGEGLLVYLTGKQYREGRSLDELAAYVETMKTQVCHWFTVEDLHHLRRGGRLSSVEAIVGSALKIKPILSVDAKGKLVVVAKERGTKKALGYLLNRFAAEGEAPAEATVIVGHTNAPESAEYVAEALRSQYPGIDIRIEKIGPIIGAHVGAGMCALVYVGKNYNF
ncbi:MAG: DegV family protein [Lachnospiraceae bacterium]|nr:DegV family protein [Lachnospiraceae bacterium]